MGIGRLSHVLAVRSALDHATCGRAFETVRSSVTAQECFLEGVVDRTALKVQHLVLNGTNSLSIQEHPGVNEGTIDSTGNERDHHESKELDDAMRRAWHCQPTEYFTANKRSWKQLVQVSALVFTACSCFVFLFFSLETLTH